MAIPSPNEGGKVYACLQEKAPAVWYLKDTEYPERAENSLNIWQRDDVSVKVATSKRKDSRYEGVTTNDNDMTKEFNISWKMPSAMISSM